MVRHKSTPLQSLPNDLHDLDYLQYAGLVPSLSLTYLRYYEAEQPLPKPRERQERRRSEMDDEEPETSHIKVRTRRGAQGVASSIGDGDIDMDDAELAGNEDSGHSRRLTKHRNDMKKEGVLVIEDADERETQKAVEELIRHAGNDPLEDASVSTYMDDTSPEISSSSTPGIPTSHPLSHLLIRLSPMQEIVTQAILDQSEPTSLEDICTYISRVKNLPRRDPQLRQDALNVLKATVKMQGGITGRLFKEDPKDSGNWAFVRDNSTAKIRRTPIFGESDLQVVDGEELDLETANGVDEYNSFASRQDNAEHMPVFTDLQTVLLKYMIARGNQPVSCADLHAVAEKNWNEIRRRDGTPYYRECRRVVNTTLASGRPEHQLFNRVDNDVKIEEAMWVPGQRAMEMLKPFVEKKEKVVPRVSGRPPLPKRKTPEPEQPVIEFSELIVSILKQSRRGGMTTDKLVESLEVEKIKYHVTNLEYSDDVHDSMITEMAKHPSVFIRSSDRKEYWMLVNDQDSTDSKRSSDVERTPVKRVKQNDGSTSTRYGTRKRK